MPAAVRFLDIIQTLGRHRVAFVVVGGVAAILEGVPVSTFALDIIHKRDSENHNRLLAALRELNARYFDPAGRTTLRSWRHSACIGSSRTPVPSTFSRKSRRASATKTRPAGGQGRA